MKTTTDVLLLELTPQDVLDKRMEHVVNLVNLAEDLGFDINGFMDENDLMKKMKNVELELLTTFIAMKESVADEVTVLKQELRLEKFHAIACRILDALGKY